jgi:hypothetical protein
MRFQMVKYFTRPYANVQGFRNRFRETECDPEELYGLFRFDLIISLRVNYKMFRQSLVRTAFVLMEAN